MATGPLPPPLFGGTDIALDQELVSLNDEQVKEILVRLGIHALFLVPPGDRLTAVIDDRQPTHRLFFARWTGAPKEADNGYVLLGYRRSQHSEAQFQSYVYDFMQTYSNVDTVKVAHGLNGPQ